LDYFQPEQVPRWDREYCGDDLIHRDNNHTAYKVARAFGGGVESVQPCSRYSVQIVKGKRVKIGFAPRRGFRKNDFNHFTCGWFLDMDGGVLWSQDGTLGRAYANDSIPVGSVL
jgi:hypothetical protein